MFQFLCFLQWLKVCILWYFASTYDLIKLLYLTLFSEQDARVIAGIPLRNTAGEDVLIWHFERYGMYTVRSGYHVAHGSTLRTKCSGRGGRGGDENMEDPSTTTDKIVCLESLHGVFSIQNESL